MSYKHKRSNVPGKVPASADFLDGEILVNTADGRAFINTPSGVKTLLNSDDIPPPNTANVGAAVAGASNKSSPADGDTFAGIEAGGSNMFKTTWANIKAALSSAFLPRTGGIMTGELSTTSSNSFRMINGGKSMFWRLDGSNLYLMISDTETGMWNDLRPFQVNRSTGKVHIHNGLSVSGGITGTASWASGATYADRLGSGGWTLADVQGQLNWRVTDARSAGWISQELRTTGRDTNSAMGASGYYATSFSKRNVEVVDVGFRQPQIYIPNVGWRALGGW